LTRRDGPLAHALALLRVEVVLLHVIYPLLFLLLELKGLLEIEGCDFAELKGVRMDEDSC
jgi:hypothetical protein